MSTTIGVWMMSAVVMGFVSAPHCIGMCGGTVSAIALHTEISAFRSLLLYNLGRVFSYTVAGLLMGAIGSFTEIASQTVGLQGVASMIGGTLMLLWVFRKFTLPLGKIWSKLFRTQASCSSEQAASKPVGSKRWKGSIHYLMMGIAMGWIPCGLTYAMEIQAAASGSWWKGATLMAIFGLSTMPTLMIVGLTAARIKKTWRKALRVIGERLVILMGILAILRGFAANDWIPSIHPWLW